MPKPEVKIRKARDADKPTIMDILANTPEFTPAEVIVAEEVLVAHLDDPAGSGYHTIVATVDSKVMGYAVYGITPLTEATWDLYWIAVDRNAKGMGIGKELLKYTEEAIKKANARMMLIETSAKPGYENTLAFYKSQGYKIICRIDHFYAENDDKVVFQKTFR